MRTVIASGAATIAAVAVAVAGAVAIGDAQTSDLEVLQLRPNFYMIAAPGGTGGNVGVQVGEDGIVVIDSGPAAVADKVVAAIKRISPAPIRYVINTAADADHVGGNEIVAKAGQTLLLARSIALPETFLGAGPASILAAEQVLTRMSAPTGQPSPFPVAAWPTETFDYGRKYMYLNGEGIEVLHQPAAHSDGDSFVFFRRADVVMAGDVLDTTRFPVIDVARGGSVQGEIAALNRLVDLAITSVPIVSREAGTIVVPGHGHLCDQLDVADYRDMVTIIRDRVQELIAAGQNLEQIKAAAPARGYTRRYGADTGRWTTAQFIEAVYRSLTQAKSS
jgi:cyclase